MPEPPTLWFGGSAVCEKNETRSVVLGRKSQCNSASRKLSNRDSRFVYLQGANPPLGIEFQDDGVPRIIVVLGESRNERAGIPLAG